MPSTELLEAVAVTAELCGRSFSEPAARMFMTDLAAYPEPAVVKALARCRKEVRGALTVQDVVSRLDDGRPGPEEAWSLMPMSEAQSVVWTDEMAGAWSVALPLLEEGDKVAARMAFKESYTRLVNEARDSGKPVNWLASLGFDPRGRDVALAEAVSRGRISLGFAQQFAPALEAPAPEVLDRVLPAVKLAVIEGGRP
jgi:hypothetical protein